METNNDIMEKCSICLGEMIMKVETLCNHVFCQECLDTWLAYETWKWSQEELERLLEESWCVVWCPCPACNEFSLPRQPRAGTCPICYQRVSYYRFL